jgi:hypothetical protein
MGCGEINLLGIGPLWLVFLFGGGDETGGSMTTGIS